MHRSFTILALALLATVASAQYCTNAPSGFSCAIDEWISNVTVAAINNSTPCGVGYEDFSSMNCGFAANGVYPASVTCSQWFNATDQITIYVDWNSDFDFTDAGEQFPLVQGAAGFAVTYTGTVTAPAVISANPRMRVVLNWGAPLACPATTQTFGNCEDYGYQPFTLTWTSAGSGSIGFTLAGGDANGTYINIVTLNAGAYPLGWFYGIDTSFGEIVNEVNTGWPFVGGLDGAGGYVLSPISGVPSGLTVYAVAFSAAGGAFTPASKHTVATTYTVP